MKRVTAAQLLEWTGGRLHSGETIATAVSLSTDTRAIEKDGVFVALRGDCFDGHDFLPQAVLQGAGILVVEQPLPSCAVTTIVVEDTRQALLDIAKGYRALFPIPLVAVTGSVGKTTTKEMIASVLEQKYHCLKTEGNFNNEIGLPLTLLRLDDSYGIGVVELGMSHAGEIARMAPVAAADTAVISNIGMSHIEHLGSRENILRAKLEIREGFSENGELWVNGDDDLLQTVDGARTYGCAEGRDLVAREVELTEDGSRFTVELDGERYPISLHIPGRHNVYNALAAIAVGRRFGVEPAAIVRGLEQSESVGMRMRLEQVEGLSLIVDCYNASPDSMRAALTVLQHHTSTRKIAVLGDMLEMGSFAPRAHREVGLFAGKVGADAVFCLGEQAACLAEGARESGVASVVCATSMEELLQQLLPFLRNGDGVLIKGSRGMKMERVCDAIQQRWGEKKPCGSC